MGYTVHQAKVTPWRNTAWSSVAKISAMQSRCHHSPEQLSCIPCFSHNVFCSRIKIWPNCIPQYSTHWKNLLPFPLQIDLMKYLELYIQQRFLLLLTTTPPSASLKCDTRGPTPRPCGSSLSKITVNVSLDKSWYFYVEHISSIWCRMWSFILDERMFQAEGAVQKFVFVLVDYVPQL